MCGLIRFTHFITNQYSADTVLVTHRCLRNHERVHYPSKFQSEPADGIYGLIDQDLILDHDWLRVCETTLKEKSGAEMNTLVMGARYARVAALYLNTGGDPRILPMTSLYNGSTVEPFSCPQDGNWYHFGQGYHFFSQNDYLKKKKPFWLHFFFSVGK